MILKLQQGGNALPPLVSYQPVTVTGGATAGASVAAPSDNQQTTDLTDKDLLQMLEKLDGLPSDMAVLTQTLQNFYIDQQYSPFPSISNIASRYLQALNQMKIANFNRKEYDDAFSTVNKNGGINEFAVTDRGQLFCMNSEGDFKLFSLEQLKENPDYQPLTNSELLYYRAQSPQLANNNELLKVVKNGIGIESITKMIQSSIGYLGTTTESSDGFARTQASQLIDGLQEFMNAQQQSGNYNATVDNLYKGNFLTKNQARQAQAALNYIYATLPANAKTLLKTKTQNGTDAEAVQLVQTLINSKLNWTADFSLDLQKPSTSSDNSSSKDATPKMSLAENIQRGGGTPIAMPFKYGTIDTMIADARMYPVTKKNGESIGSNSTLQKFTEDSQITGLYDLTQVTFGDQVIPTSGIKDILVEDPTIYHAYLPINQDQASKGIITPDMNSIARLEEAKKKLKELGIESVENAKTPREIEIINQVYAELKLPPIKLQDGEFTQYYRQFGILQGDALSDAFSDPNSVILGDSPMLQNIEEESIAQSIFDLIKGPNSKEKYDHRGLLDMHIWGNPNHQSIFKGLIFLPLKTTDRNYGKMVAGNDITEKEAIENQMRYQQEQRLKNTTIVKGQL